MTNDAPLAIVIGEDEQIVPVVSRLTAHGWRVLLAGDNTTKLASIAESIGSQHPDADPLTVRQLSLGSMRSIQEFAMYVLIHLDRWNALYIFGSARVTPERLLTEDGFEWQLGVNYLGPFALTGLILPGAATDARIITLVSLTYHRGSVRFHDLRWDHKYRPTRAHAMSKLAMLSLSAELARRIDDPLMPEYPSTLRSIAVYPGNRPGKDVPTGRRLVSRVLHQSLDHATEVITFAGLDPTVPNGAYVVPTGAGHLTGAPTIAPLPTATVDIMTALRLWRVSGQLTRVTW